MNKTLLKFTNYLDQSAKELEQRVVNSVGKKEDKKPDFLERAQIQKYNERINMSRILKIPRESWDMYGELFVQFDVLSDLMIAAGLRNKEIFTVIFYLLEKNLGAHVLDASVRFFDLNKMEHYDFSSYKYLNKKVILELVRTEEYGRLASAPEGTLSKEEQEKLDEFERFTMENPEDLTGVIEKHKLLQKHYFDKIDSLDNEDIEVIISILREFKLAEEHINIVRELLIQKEEKRKKMEIPIIVDKVQASEVKLGLSEKEYNLLNRELRKYFDVTNMKMVQPLNEELQIYVVSLMLKMGYNLDIIRKALKVMNKDSVVEDNPIVKFIKLYSKLKYYENIPSVKEAVDNIMSYLQEIFIVNEEDYLIYKEMIGEELSGIQRDIPNNFEYEIEEARKLVK